MSLCPCCYVASVNQALSLNMPRENEFGINYTEHIKNDLPGKRSLLFMGIYDQQKLIWYVCRLWDMVVCCCLGSS